ncbi:MAG: VWA domain-containing protein [Ilumatobacter sp.]|jgi:Ca-activated chloride channel homolog|uniref:VWA domain-containing protein n=1 Tax=Ilumatobacter sp. TaxID=1967498 RepID=UPI001D3346B9|nr:VWA domain-containing protein [Ilumatobacter sp.]MBT5277510.1 VWA domain-containing protein [Ilumatobacter sp.]MBT5553968.1 VWA domain-containing protein [Ilumatobacter sp.]MBT5866743.1 VWA domain-containing protein [Ilumatobacter sp.]MBT7431040.1 VWA domain-containing protein [Ilumatobacter sp.]
MSRDFLEPGRLWLLLIVAALAVLYVVVLRWRSTASIRFTQMDLLDEIAPERPNWRRHLVAVLQLVGLAAAVIAIARPVDRATERTKSEGRILVAFDVSLSMEADDVDPSRFESARVAAREFIDEVDNNVEVGLISFSGVVDVAVDPTLDRSALDRGLDRLELDESTAIGDALSVSTRLLVNATDDASGDEAADQDDDVAPGVIVLLSDGETTVGRLTSEGAQEAADAGVPVFTIAFGTDAGVITDPVSGDRVPVPVRPADLELVAETTGGAAFVAETGGELAAVYDQIQMSLGDTLGEEIEIVKELTWRWALGAFLVLALAWALSLWWLRGMV